MTTSPWTDEIIATLLEFWKEQSASKLANTIFDRHQVQFTRNSVVGRLHRMGLKVGNIVGTERHSPRPRAKPVHRSPSKRKLKIVATGKGSHLRMMESVVRELPPLRCVESSSRNLTIYELGPDDCRYPHGDQAPYTFCGRSVAPDKSWCRDCCRIIYEPSKPRRGSDKPTWRTAA